MHWLIKVTVNFLTMPSLSPSLALSRWLFIRSAVSSHWMWNIPCFYLVPFGTIFRCGCSSFNDLPGPTHISTIVMNSGTYHDTRETWISLSTVLAWQKVTIPPKNQRIFYYRSSQRLITNAQNVDLALVLFCLLFFFCASQPPIQLCLLFHVARTHVWKIMKLN